MNEGKKTCEYLKEVRRKLAEINNIEYSEKECTHDGECLGTCPYCEAKTNELNALLKDKEASGDEVVWTVEENADVFMPEVVTDDIRVETCGLLSLEDDRMGEINVSLPDGFPELTTEVLMGDVSYDRNLTTDSEVLNNLELSNQLTGYVGLMNDEISDSDKLTRTKEMNEQIHASFSDCLKYMSENDYDVDKAISAWKIDTVKKLRQETGNGMADCKRALEKTDWNIDEAKKYLKEHRPFGLTRLLGCVSCDKDD